MIRMIDLFAGIGGMRLGMEKIFPDAQTVFVSEIDKFARQTYRDNFKSPKEIAGDITQIPADIIPPFDICLAGFPCQAFSHAGKRAGFDDTRGNLFWEIIRICQFHRPKIIFCENVKGLVTHAKGKTFKIICDAFQDLGYSVHFKLLNSKDFGLAQNRERVYIVCTHGDFTFPTATDSSATIADILEPAPIPAKYYLSACYLETLRRHKARHQAAGHGFGYEIKSLDSVANALVCGGMGRERNLIIDPRPHSLLPTTRIKGGINAENIRKLTPRELAS